MPSIAFAQGFAQVSSAMVQTGDAPEKTPAKGQWRRWPRLLPRVLLILLAIALVAAWGQREDIADTLITDYFAKQDVPASYGIESIGAQEQVLTNVVIGDPDRPDLTIEQLKLIIAPRLGLPGVKRLEVINPRLYGTVADGTVSFGSLDPLIFTGSEAPFEFPDMELVVRDGRGRIASEAGALGITLSGEGHLRGGFAGELAVVAEQLAFGGCIAERPTLYGQVSIDAERPMLAGPLRLTSLECDGIGLSLEESAIELALQADRNLSDFEGEGQLDTGQLTLARNGMEALGGDIAISWRDEALTARYDLTGLGISTDYADLGSLAAAGDLRADSGFARISLEGDARGEGIVPGGAITQSLASVQDAATGTLADPLIAKFRQALIAETRSSTLDASFTARRDEGEDFALVLPEARWQGSSGANLLSLSRVQMSTGEGVSSFDGNFATGGANMPRLSGRMEQEQGGALTLRLAMQEYSAGEARVAIPRLAITPGRGNSVAIEGLARASGAIPGGFVEGLTVPIDGTVSSNGALALWDGCRKVAFDRLELASLVLDKQTLGLCPQDDGPMLRYDAEGLALAVRSERLDLAGRYGDTPLTLASGPIALSFPEMIAVPDLSVTYGTGEEAIRFNAASVTTDLTAESLQGKFAGAKVVLPAIPLDITEGSGAWTFAEQILDIKQGAFTLSDREAPARFNPLVAQGAKLSLVDNVIDADAILRHPFTNAEVVRVDIEHNLTSEKGGADLVVSDLTFTDELQPYDLTDLALGVVANVEGTVTGSGSIDWTPEKITSTGRFATDNADFAAVFGPVEGAKGAIVFTDLLGMTTAPNQRFTIEAINPGIEVYDGEVAVSIEGGTLLRFEGGRWPLLGGTMVMRPVDINVGAIEERTYLVEIEGLEASQFISRMELNNLDANGTFDGTIPIVFDADGNGRLEGGVLVSRPPGGNLAYVGELTYEDLGTMGNLAFGALRDLSYRRMEILMDGPLTGELVTRVSFDSIGQGETAQSNLITRQIAKLPIELRINIRAPFYQLISSTRSLYDPSAVRDPQALGLIDQPLEQVLSPGRAPQEPEPQESPQGLRPAETRNEPEIQPSESEAGL